MINKFKNKYRIQSARLQTWDYSWSAAYFITICTKDMKHYFGKIENHKMILSDLGIIANLFWDEIKNHAKNITLGEFIVMPNHINGILILNDSNDINTVVLDTSNTMYLQINDHQKNDNQTNDNQINNNQTNDNQINDNQTNDNQINNNQTNDNQINNNQTNDNQMIIK